jgi:hypothetical protein
LHSRIPFSKFRLLAIELLTLFLNFADSVSSLGELSQDSLSSQDLVPMGQANSGGSCPCNSRASSEYCEPDPYEPWPYAPDLYEGEPTREEAWLESDIRDAEQDYADRQASAAMESTGNDYIPQEFGFQTTSLRSKSLLQRNILGSKLDSAFTLGGCEA